MTDDRKIPVHCYSRIVGYYQVVTNTSPGKREEIAERKLFETKQLQSRLNEIKDR